MIVFEEGWECLIQGSLCVIIRNSSLNDSVENNKLDDINGSNKETMI